MGGKGKVKKEYLHLITETREQAVEGYLK